MKKRALFLLAVVAATLVVASGVALAATIQCPNRADGTCIGTKKADTMKGTPQPDQIRARSGDDLVKAGGGDGDFSIGGPGADRIRGQAGADQVIGGGIRGNFETGDLFFADNKDDVVRGGGGDDPTIAGGYGKGGEDKLFGGKGNDTLYAAQRGFPYRGHVQVNKEIVDCGPGKNDVAYYDKGVDVVKDNCERKINGFPDISGARQSSGAGLLFEGSAQ